jgi:very-short-patch-repair endonuclease
MPKKFTSAARKLRKHAILKDKDKKREAWLNAEGFVVMRFWNNEVFENLDGVLQAIRTKLATPSPDPSLQGRGNESES